MNRTEIHIIIHEGSLHVQLYIPARVLWALLAVVTAVTSSPIALSWLEYMLR